MITQFTPYKKIFKNEYQTKAVAAINLMKQTHKPLRTKICVFCGECGKLSSDYLRDEDGIPVGAYVQCGSCQMKVSARWRPGEK